MRFLLSRLISCVFNTNVTPRGGGYHPLPKVFYTEHFLNHNHWHYLGILLSIHIETFYLLVYDTRLRLAHFISLNFRDPNFRLFWGLGLLLGYLGILPVQNLTSDSCFATPISYYGDEISRLSCLVIEIPILGYLGFLGGDLGVFSYFQRKIWRILARRPWFPIWVTKFRAYLA